jgi:COMPASS component SWD1
MSHFYLFIYLTKETCSDVAVNCSDKVIRVFSYSDLGAEVKLELMHKFLDSVDQSRWTNCCFSVDSEYLIGGQFKLKLALGLLTEDIKLGSAAKHLHKIYIWEKTTGALVKMLEGPKEGLVDVAVRVYCHFVARKLLIFVRQFSGIHRGPY